MAHITVGKHYAFALDDFVDNPENSDWPGAVVKRLPNGDFRVSMNSNDPYDFEDFVNERITNDDPDSTDEIMDTYSEDDSTDAVTQTQTVLSAAGITATPSGQVGPAKNPSTILYSGEPREVVVKALQGAWGKPKQRDSATLWNRGDFTVAVDYIGNVFVYRNRKNPRQ